MTEKTDKFPNSTEADGPFQEEQLEAASLNLAERKIKACEYLDGLKEPVIATVIIGPSEAFDYRNLAFWEGFQQRDRNLIDKLNEWLNNKRKGKL